MEKDLLYIKNDTYYLFNNRFNTARQIFRIYNLTFFINWSISITNEFNRPIYEKSVIKYYSQIIKPISEYIDVSLKSKLDELLIKFNCEVDIFPIYSDKVANEFDSFSSIYLDSKVSNNEYFGCILKKKPAKYIV